MSSLALPRTAFRRVFSFHFARRYASAPSSEPSQSSKATSSSAESKIISSCQAGTVLTGLNYLKGEPPILAKADEEYPSWLWDLTKPKTSADNDKAEKQRLRREHRQQLQVKNMFKTTDGSVADFG
ncbi:mitochondrial ribosomal protein L37-domain-containing protein [Melanogaster broomeanus]|nr:mitochondrial ribosomal protein L37-domain-containing protein [Melanogaster broomeanus]